MLLAPSPVPAVGPRTCRMPPGVPTLGHQSGHTRLDATLTLKMSKWVWQGQPEAVKVGHFYLLRLRPPRCPSRKRPVVLATGATVVLSYCVLSCLLRSSSHEYTRSFILRASARILNVSSSSTNRRQSSKQELAIGPKAEREARLGRTPTAGQQGLRVVCPRAWEVEHVAGPEHRLERCGDSIERRRT